jgi:hypothetical protein
LRAVAAMHAEFIAEHGGLAGPVRIAELEAALGRPQQQYSYFKPTPSLERLEFALKNGASLRTACDLLNERGIASTGGGRWHAPSLLKAAKRLGLR